MVSLLGIYYVGCCIEFWHLCFVLTKKMPESLLFWISQGRHVWLHGFVWCWGPTETLHDRPFPADVNIFLASFFPSLLSSFFSVFFTTCFYLSFAHMLQSSKNVDSWWLHSFVTAPLYNTLNKVMKGGIFCFVDRASLYNLFQMKPTRCTLLLSIIISTSLHVSGNYVPIIRRTYCIYATLVFFTLCG